MLWIFVYDGATPPPPTMISYLHLITLNPMGTYAIRVLSLYGVTLLPRVLRRRCVAL